MSGAPFVGGRLLTLVLAGFLGSSGILYAQPLVPLTAYVQVVPLWTTSTPASEEGASAFGRVRLTAEPTLGPLSVRVSYEHALTLRQSPLAAETNIARVPGGGERLDLQWSVAERRHVRWRHRFDRLQVDWSPRSAVQFTAGRQAISWGTTLLLTPADPFAPFSPADPFREFRAGIDAGRVRAYPGPLSEIDLVVRPSDTLAGEEFTSLGRGLTTWRNWELSAWGGSLYGDAAAAVGATGSLANWAIRGEGVVREQPDGPVFRGTIGVDHLRQIGERDLYIVLEYQRDGLGASTPARYASLLASDTFLRGEHQVLGRDETALQGSYRVHPLWSLAGLWLWNLNDRSALVSPSVSYSASDAAGVTVGAFLGIGDDKIAQTRPVPSEFGLSGTTAFASLSWFF